MKTYDRRILRALETFKDEKIPDTIPDSLPLLGDSREKHPNPSIYENFDVLFIQHHLGPFTVRLAAMCEDGLDMARTWFVDIPYSTCPEALAEVHKGCPKDHTLERFNDPLVPYSETQMARVLILLRELAQQRGENLLVVDDGGYFLRALYLLNVAKPSLAERFRGTRVVEQTTRGHRVVESSPELIRSFDLSVVSIAKCKTKKEFESPFIGAAVARGIVQTLKANSEIADGFRRAAVLGFGPVGKSVTEALMRTYSKMTIDVVDPDINKHRDIKNIEANPLSELPEYLENGDGYDLVAGCTGYNSFQLHQRRLLARTAVLASGSSAAVEFNRAGFIELADAYPDDEIEVLNRESIEGKIHATISLAHEGGKVMHFLNAGFPVNFDGRMECLPARMIQATHCLLHHAGCQVLKQETPGFFELDEGIDEWLLKKAPSYL